MRFFRSVFILSLFISLFYLPVSAQNDSEVLNQLLAKSAKAYTDLPIEKVYLHFDKPYYAVGDTIWFKAYLTTGIHQPSLLSKIIYVDFLAPRDSLAQSLKLQVKNGVTWGHIALNQNVYKKGNYRIVAYTNYMNNLGVAYFFNKNITLGDAINNPLSAQVSLKKTASGKSSKISAGIFYKDNDGMPFAEKRVSWSVERDDESIAKGKGITDKNGFIDISFINTKNLSLDSADLVTQIENRQQKLVTNSFSLKPVSRPNDLQFFPEGGQLISGVRTKIAFKAIKPDGLGIDVKGTITDNNNNVVNEFSSSHLGMGAFILTPEDGKTYTAHVTYADGTSANPVFPKVGSNGIDLSVDNNDPENLNIKLQADEAFLKDFQGKTFFIIGKSSGAIAFAAKLQLPGPIYSASIPKSKFPTGIVQLTLFTNEGEPVSERIAFIQHNDQLNLTVNSDHPDYETRQLAKLKLTAKNSGQPDEGNFSVSVIDESKVPFDENAESTILTNLLLTSDINGFIEKPNYYFNHPDQQAQADLDILLQTQGYRRYSYDDIINNKQRPVAFAVEKGIDIIGTLRSSSGIPVNRGNVHISIPDKNYFANTITNADGRFIFPNLVFPDSAKVMLSARDNIHASDLVLTVDGEPRQSIPINYAEPDGIANIDSVLSPYLKNSKLQFNNLHILKEVVIRDKRIVKTVSHKDYGNLASLSDQPDHVIKADQLDGCNSLLECIKSLAAGMTFDNENFYVSRDYIQGKRIPTQVFVKGMPVDASYLQSVDPKTVESIEIFTKDELGLINSAYNSNGAIVVNLRKMETQKISYQDLKQLIGSRNEVTLLPKGYEPVKTFYMPRYTGPRANQPAQIDTRSTIYWNPNIETDKTGNAEVDYFNADGKGTYRVTVEGLDKDGNIGRVVYRYHVK
ncbi:carboxypeptidase regulatory-like domain-containing protein [Mucilaginibacter sp.]|uniref:carboxypeptidase regulatory-like domain-containing protein n=1 Tax=Mucilaginibacter sp. TaxID=1882438 RepID=UPI0028463C69|nr:carboxypeptidase regulatory-like domain-containing protein [Mucilaginibacter sp.]MDR3694904.1 carboxypeptidase regulatory-like domain-containing protein [Mucilaginibacter sp.]